MTDTFHNDTDNFKFHIMTDEEIRLLKNKRKKYLLSKITPLMNALNRQDSDLKHIVQKQLMRLKVICDTFHTDADLCFKKAAEYLLNPKQLEQYVSDVLHQAHLHKEQLDTLIRHGTDLRKKVNVTWPEIFNQSNSNDIYIRLKNPLSTIHELLQQRLNELNADTPAEETLSLEQQDKSWRIKNNKTSMRAIAFFEKRIHWLNHFKSAFYKIPPEARADFLYILASVKNHKELTRPAFGTGIMKQIKDGYNLSEWPLAIPADIFYYLKHYLNKSYFHHTNLPIDVLSDKAFTQLNSIYKDILTQITSATHQLSHKNNKNTLSENADEKLDFIILSKSPTRLARMSTYTDWDLASCRFIGHDFHHEIIDDIGFGTIIALGFSSKNPFRPLCRSLIKPFENEKNDPFYDTEPAYGLIIGHFQETLQQIIQNTFYKKETALNGCYTIRSNLVSENNRNMFHIAPDPMTYAKNIGNKTMSVLTEDDQKTKTVLVGAFNYLDFYQSDHMKLVSPDWSNTLIDGIFSASGAVDFSKMPRSCHKLELRYFYGKSLKEITTQHKTLSLVRPNISRFKLDELQKECRHLELHLLKTPLPHLSAPNLESLIWYKTPIEQSDVLDLKKISRALFNAALINNNTSIHWPKTCRFQECDIRCANFSDVKELSVSNTTLNATFINFPNEGDIFAEKIFCAPNQVIDFGTVKHIDMIKSNMGMTTKLIAPEKGHFICHESQLPSLIDLSRCETFELKNCVYHPQTTLILSDKTTLYLNHPSCIDNRNFICKDKTGNLILSDFIFEKGSVLTQEEDMVIFKNCKTDLLKTKRVKQNSHSSVFLKKSSNENT